MGNPALDPRFRGEGQTLPHLLRGRPPQGGVRGPPPPAPGTEGGWLRQTPQHSPLTALAEPPNPFPALPRPWEPASVRQEMRENQRGKNRGGGGLSSILLGPAGVRGPRRCSAPCSRPHARQVPRVAEARRAGGLGFPARPPPPPGPRPWELASNSQRWLPQHWGIFILPPPE